MEEEKRIVTLLDQSYRSVQSIDREPDICGNIAVSSEGTNYTGDTLPVSVGLSKKGPKWWSINPITLWKYTGPGWLVCIAYVDPGNLESDLQAGAVGGYELAWVLILATILGLGFQLLSLRLGVVTGKNLAELAREKYSRPVSFVLWLLIELAIIGADIQEVVGSAIAIHILSFGYIPLWAGCILTGLDTFTFLLLDWLPYGGRIIEYVFGALVFIMVAAFAIEFGSASPDLWKLLEGSFVPRLTTSTTVPAVGMLGAVVMPHNLYLHSALVLSRPLDRSDKVAKREAFKYHAIEAAIALAVSLVINLLILGLAASTFRGDTNVGLQTAGTLLSRRFGEAAIYVWAIGLLAAGQSSTMTCTLVGQYVLMGFLRIRMPAWLRVLLTRTVSILPAVIVAVVAQSYLDQLNQVLNLAQAAILPAAIVPTIDFITDPSIVGSFYFRSWKYFLLLVGIAASLLILVTNAFLVYVQAAISTYPAVFLPIVTLSVIAYFIATILLSLRRLYHPLYLSLRKYLCHPANP